MKAPSVALRLSLFLLTGCVCLHGQVTFVVTSLPSNTPAGDRIYFAGTPNAWNPGDTVFRLSPTFPPMITIPAGSGTIQYKFTRGSWPTVEGNASGTFLPNRTFSYGNGDTVQIQILSWEDLGPGTPAGTSTASPGVSLLSPAFFMPQLNRSRRIWLYLPPGYETSGRAYPVLYMQDGQNLFDKLTGFANQEWEVDESLDSLAAGGDPGCIVVGIDNGGGHRINEYSPYTFTTGGQQYGGEGAAYADFLVQTLKPYIDSTYRTLSDREHTGIAGSSMGGLIAHYAAIRYPEVFSRVGVFSPSYWMNDSIYSDTRAAGHPYPMRIYLLAGGNEGGGMLPKAQAMYDTLMHTGYAPDEVLLNVVPSGQHSEWFWRQEFPAAYQWLFREATSETSESMGSFITLSPNPGHDQVRARTLMGDKARLDLYNMMGMPVMHAFITEGDLLDITPLPEGIYLMRVEDGGKVYYERFVKN